MIVSNSLHYNNFRYDTLWRSKMLFPATCKYKHVSPISLQQKNVNLNRQSTGCNAGKS